jgi:hypothetical protein
MANNPTCAHLHPVRDGESGYSCADCGEILQFNSSAPRYREDGDNHLFDSEEGCYYVREKHAVQKANNTLEDVARMVEMSAEARSALAERIRRKKERV